MTIVLLTYTLLPYTSMYTTGSRHVSGIYVLPSRFHHIVYHEYVHYWYPPLSTYSYRDPSTPLLFLAPLLLYRMCMRELLDGHEICC